MDLGLTLCARTISTQKFTYKTYINILSLCIKKDNLLNIKKSILCDILAVITEKLSSVFKGKYRDKILLRILQS